MKKFLPLSVLACAAVFCGFSVLGADYYISSGGSDDANRSGAANEPYATLEYALTKAVNDGDRVLINTGTYTLVQSTKETKLVVSNGITISSVSGKPEDVILTKASQRLIKLNHKDAVLAGVTLEGGTSGDTAVYDDEYNHDGVGAMIKAGTVTNCIIRGASYGSNGRGRAAVALNGENAKLLYSVVSNNTCNKTDSNGPVDVIKGLVKGCLVCDNGIDRGDHTLKGGSGCFTGGTVEDCVFTRNRSRGVAGVYSKGATVTNCIIWDNYAQGDIADGRDVWGGTAANFKGCVARIAINENCTATTDPGRYGPLMKKVEALNLTTSVTRAIVPFEVTLTAVNGSAPYVWDFGDGSEARETAEPTVTHTYVTAGVYTPSVTSGGQTVDRPDLIEAMGAKMYVKKDNATARFPYATQETAAATPMDAADRCIDGQEVLLEDGDYPTPRTVCIGRAVTFRSLSGDRDQVILNASANTVDIRSLLVNHPQARVEGLTSIGRGLQVVGAGLYLFGGMVSNCVFRNGSISGHGAHSMLEVNGEDALLTHCWITNNTASCQGVQAATSVRIDDGAKVVNCFIADNKETTTGSDLSSGVWVKNGTLENCTVVNNQGQRTGGVRATAGRVVNCVIAGNTSRKRGAGYHDVEPGSDDLFDHCAVGEVELGGVNVNYKGAPAELFENYAQGDLRPKSGSLLVDKGATVADPEATDLGGKNRIEGMAIDIGCYERPARGFAVNFYTDAPSRVAVPADVAFEATVEGTTGAENLVYAWDFDGDGVFEQTNDTAKAIGHLVKYGNVTVSLKAIDLNTGRESAVETKPDLFFCAPAVMHVVLGNEGAAYPHDTEANAAASIAEALAATIPGVTVLLHPDTYEIDPAGLTIPAGVTLASSTLNPEDVFFVHPNNAAGKYFLLTEAGSGLSSVTIDSATPVQGSYAAGASILNVSKGIVTNCVIRNSTTGSGDYWAVNAIQVSGTGVLSGCVITNNTGSSPSVTSFLAVQGGRVENCLIADFRMKDPALGCKGASAYVTGGVVTNCIFARNRSATVGGVCAEGGLVTDCLIWQNRAYGDVDTTLKDIYAGDASRFERCVARVVINETCTATTDPGLYGLEMKPVEGLNFTSTHTRAIVPFEATFTATEGSAPYVWDFGDDSGFQQTSEPFVTHEYRTPGRYTPSVTCGGVTRDRPGLIEAVGETVYVVKDNTGAAYPYDTEAKAAADLKSALWDAIDGQTIEIADDTYALPETLCVGWGVTLRSKSTGRDKVILDTTKNNYRPLYVDHPAARIESITCRGARGSQIEGSDILVMAGVISNCVFRDSVQAAGGYGKSHVTGNGANAYFTHCVISNNNSRFTGNLAANGIWLKNGAKAVNCLIFKNVDNTSTAEKSACVRVESYATIENCTIIGNEAQLTGGVYADGGHVVNCVIAGNTALKKGPGYHDVYPGFDDAFDHCAVAEVELGGANVNYHDSMANMFVDAARGAFLPAGGSCLVDKGLTPEEPEATDLGGTNRVMGTAIDIGCYERPAGGFAAHVSSDIAEGLLPLTVTFTAIAEGTNGTDDVVFVWDFDCDGEFEVTNRATRVTHVYAGAGRQTVSLKALNLTTGAETEVETKPDFINAVPKVLHVRSGNADAAYPYDSETNAAATIADALAVAIDGVTVLVHPETYPNETMMTIGKEVTIRGATDNPADVVVKPANNGVDYLFKLNHPKALVCNLTVEGNTARALIGNDTQGGTVSNCIVRAFKTNSTWALGPVWLTTAGSLATHLVVSNCDVSTRGPGDAYVNSVAGGIRLTDGARAENCLVVDCAATANVHGTGGILLLGKSSAVNCTVAHCTGREVGGCCASSSENHPNSSVITNCLFVDTSATMEGGAAVVNADQLDRCVTCAADVDVAAGWQKGTPGQFFRNDAKRDFRPPNSTAPLYRTGTFVPHIYAEPDLIGRPRKQNGRLDIGCFDVKATGLMLLAR